MSCSEWVVGLLSSETGTSSRTPVLLVRSIVAERLLNHWGTWVYGDVYTGEIGDKGLDMYVIE